MSAGNLLEAIVLGVIQGIAEFLPISSSGHLVICADIIKAFTGEEFDPEASLQMNVALHAGTLLSIVIVYRKILLKMIFQPNSWSPILIATAPLVLIALTPIKDMMEAMATPMVAGVCLLVTAALLFLSARFQGKSDPEPPADIEVPIWKAAIIGLFQAFALLPGISRSGSTITSALFLGISREEAARFSFLIAIPAISGATLLMLKDYFSEGAKSSVSLMPLAVGALVSFLVGLFALKWLLKIIARGKLHYFGWYCLTVGLLTIGWKLFI
ncbi:Undecaprenyl-diphosphatase [Polystyrenella longa]|uniref:Undecaprenyl-diphosphatase n=1 Tax=Polystyrenella longa TaxID=2528007 RepID=A0A518CKE8_9PLAN|nr:undecaprenyl-diphosphate phosphatase [Polystyrenella longa]QDU79705.1 Undecaprenyl-diphosphatase [Polystyrenella longa]